VVRGNGPDAIDRSAKNDNEAVRLFRLAADQGNALGQANLGIMYAQGRGGLAKDDKEAVRLYRLAADQGDALAQANLGSMYEQGRGGLTKDNGEALRLYRLAAAQGNEFALKAVERLTGAR
jgi:TPR repeat protein